MMNNQKIVIGTRGSKLALWQANLVGRKLGCDYEIKIIKTTGDIDRFSPISSTGKVGIFVKEIEKAIIEKIVDIGVHSLKDLPTVLSDELIISGVIKRDFVSDVIVVEGNCSEEEILFRASSGMRIGTSSLRRMSLIKNFFNGAQAVPIRGNVETRLKKLKMQECDALILSRAGIERLELKLDGFSVFELEPFVWLPSPGQGVIAIESRKGDDVILNLCSKISHQETMTACTIERETMRLCGGGCHFAFGAYARKNNGEWILNIGMEDSTGKWHSVESKGEGLDIANSAVNLLKSLKITENEKQQILLRRIFI